MNEEERQEKDLQRKRLEIERLEKEILHKIKKNQEKGKKEPQPYVIKSLNKTPEVIDRANFNENKDQKNREGYEFKVNLDNLNQSKEIRYQIARHKIEPKLRKISYKIYEYDFDVPLEFMFDYLLDFSNILTTDTGEKVPKIDINENEYYIQGTAGPGYFKIVKKVLNEKIIYEYDFLNNDRIGEKGRLTIGFFEHSPESVKLTIRNEITELKQDYIEKGYIPNWFGSLGNTIKWNMPQILAKLNKELRTKIIDSVDDLQAYMDNNFNQLKEFIGQLQKKLPLPQYIDINKKYFGIKKQLSLFFTCGSQKEGCLHSNSNAFIITTSEWNKWLKISISAIKIGSSILRIAGGSVLEEIKSIKELKKAYDEYKSPEFPDFLSFAREPFLLSSERDYLIQNLRDNNFFKFFEYDSINTQWVCTNCASLNL